MKTISASRLINAGLMVALCTISFVFVLSVYQSKRIKSTNAMVNHTQQVIRQLNKVVVSALDIQAGARGYVITGNNTYVDQFNRAKKELAVLLPALQSLISDNNTQTVLLDSLKVYIQKRIEVSEEMIRLRMENKAQQANQIILSGIGEYYTDKIVSACAVSEKIENSLLAERKRVNNESIENFNNTLYGVLATVLILSFLLFFKSQSGVKKQRASEKRFRDLLGAAPDAMIITGKDGVIKIINKKTMLFFGYPAGELPGTTIERLLPGILQGESLDAIKPTGFVKELPAIRKDGSIFPAEISLSPIHTIDGLLVSVSVRDITQRKKAQQQLELLLQQIDKANDAIFSVNEALEITNWNYGAEKMFGFKKEEALGQISLSLLKMEVTDAEQQNIKETVDREGYWTGEVKRYGKYGNEIFVISSITAIKDGNDKITGYISVSYDISIQKKLQAQVAHLASIVEHSSDAILSMDINKRIISWNTGAEKMFGFSIEEVTGKTATEVGIMRFTPDELRSVDIELAVKGHWHAEKKYYHKNGESFTGSVSANAIKNTAGEISTEFFIIKDISLRKQFEEYLRRYNEELELEVQERTKDIHKTEQRFKAMIENSDDLILVMDKNNIIIYRSPAAERITGRSSKEIFDLDTFKTLFEPGDFKEMLDHIKKASENPGKPVFCPFRILNKEGGFRMMEGTVTDFLQDDSIKAIVFNARDITDRKKAEERLVASEKRYREAMDNMMEGIQILNKELRYLYVNNAVAKQAGQPKEELVGNLVTDLYPGVEQTKLYKNILLCLTSGLPLQLEDEFVFPDKTVKYFQLSLQPVPDGIVILSVDITERKNAEEELRKSLHEKELLANKLTIILNTLPANIAILDSQGIIADVNDAWKTFAAGNNFRVATHGIGDNYIEIAANAAGKDDQQGKAVAKGIKDVLEHRQDQFECQYYRDSPGGQQWFRMIVSPLKNKSNYGAVVMHIDITELKRLENEQLKAKTEEQRNITRAMLEGQEKERNQIGQELHDNIVQLMAATKMKLGLYISQYGSGASILSQSMEHIQTALTETRNLSHQMVTPRFGLNAFISELERLLHDYSNDKRRVSLQMADIPENKLPVPVKETLYRIVQEQLNNIEKYAHASQVVLALSIEGNNIRMVISDNGIGFNVQQVKKGIGLMNIHNRAESYGGKAQIISSPGNGCKVCIDIPLPEQFN